jgi:hypothetical protein
LKEWTTPDFRNTPSTTNLEEGEIVDAPGNDGNASMPEQVKRPNPRRKMKYQVTSLSWELAPFFSKLAAFLFSQIAACIFEIFKFFRIPVDILCARGPV